MCLVGENPSPLFNIAFYAPEIEYSDILSIRSRVGGSVACWSFTAAEVPVYVI